MFTQDEEKVIINLYTQDYSSLAELGRKYNCDTSSIKKILLSNNIQIRSRSEQTRYTNMKRKKSCDENYFSKIDSYNKAWLIGFLAADGTIRKNINEIKIGLSTIDREILEKIKKEVKIERDILDYETSNGFAVSELSWTSFQQKKDLSIYGVVNNKTYLENHLPSFDNDNYKLAYILGYFDGDGSISLTKENYLRFRLCSYRDEILKDIKNFFEKKYNASVVICKDSTRQMYELSVSTKYAKNIFEDMYNLGSLKLNRKYQKYLEYKSHETLTS